MIFSPLNAATWGDMAKDKEKGFFEFELSPGWLGLGKLLPFLFLLSFV